MEKEIDHIRFRTIIEILGRPKEHVEETLKKYIEKIKEDSDLIILKEDYAEAKQQETMWSTFVELELVVKGVQKMIGFCFDYMPSSIEILKPEQLTFNNRDMIVFLNDLQAKLHNVDMITKQLNAENNFLKRNMQIVIKNTVMILLKTGNNTEEKLAKFTGVNKEELKLIIDKLVEEKKIKKEGDIYVLVGDVKKQN